MYKFTLSSHVFDIFNIPNIGRTHISEEEGFYIAVNDLMSDLVDEAVTDDMIDELNETLPTA